jgi:lipopolysaccharide/colanic/teichoic acid biosynthesis glycosyltransferase
MLLSPILIVTSIFIKAYDGGPVLYSQKRLTKDGRVFDIYKFRSMKVNSENGDARLASKNDDRITPVGNVIRKLRIDELPQLFNILKNDMSVVGPRPERPEIAEQYEKEIPEFGLRLKVKAGLTGYAQVYGKYNTTPLDKLKLDLLYISQRSVLFDLRIIFYTLKIVFIPESSEGVAEDQVTALENRDD